MDILTDSEILNILEKHNFRKIKKTYTGYIACCIFHNDKTPSFSISKNGLWQCFGCGKSGNWNRLLYLLGEKTNEQNNILVYKLNKYNIKPYDEMISEISKYKKILDYSTYEELNRIPEYVLKRLGKETIYHFKLGESHSVPNRCLIPVFYKGKYIGWHGRSMSLGTMPKYFNSPGLKIKDYVFNYDECEKKKDIIVLEGAFNVMSMYEKGFRNCVSTFGVNFTMAQIEKILSLSPSSITICFDNDKNKVGQMAAAKLANTFNDLIDTYIVELPEGKDPNDLDKHTLDNCLNNKKIVSVQRGIYGRYNY